MSRYRSPLRATHDLKRRVYRDMSGNREASAEFGNVRAKFISELCAQTKKNSKKKAQRTGLLARDFRTLRCLRANFARAFPNSVEASLCTANVDSRGGYQKV